MRLYPIDYQYLPSVSKYHKYQWIEVDLYEDGAKGDQRKESRKPILDNIEIVSDVISTKNGWQDRRRIIDSLPHHTVKQFQAQYLQDKTSLGVVRPSRILEMKVEAVDREWTEEQNAILSQKRMFDDQRTRALLKIPYKFSYVFECEDSDKPHNAMCEDWELGMLFLNERKRLGNDEKAIESVKKMFFDKICSPANDTRFFMGTTYPFNTWIVLGVFYPPKTEDKPEQLSLF